MMKRFTLTILGLLLMVGGVMAQTILYLDGGNTNNLSFSDEVYTDSHVTGAIVTFYGNGFNGTYSAGLSGSNWVAEYHEGETHSFTINLNEGAPAGFHFYIAAKYYDNFNSGGVYKDVTIEAGAKSLTVDINSSDCPALLEASNGNDGKGTYQYVWIINKDGSSGAKLNIASITRTITTVGKPTITAPATYDGESTAVTITPGANNHHVKYSVSGSSSDVSDVQITSETTIYITGTSDVTITAVGYNENESESNTNTKTITYSNVIPSGVITVWQGDKSFTTDGDWSTNLQLDKNQFANLEVGDYIYLNCTDVDYNNNRIGFRNSSHGDDIFGDYDALYMTITDGCAKLLVSDQKLCNKFKGENVMIKGFIFKLTSVEIHKAKTLSADADNDITKYTHMIVTVDRPFVAGTWNTVCLPFVPTADQANTLFGSGYKLAKFTGVSGTTMQFTTIAIGEFEAGKPYLVLPKTGCATGTTVLFDVDITAKNPTPVKWGNYTFTGTFTTKTFTSADNTTSRFVATENKLKTPEKNSTMKALRAYFTVPSTSLARSFTIDGFEDDTTTSISEETMVKGETSPNKIYNLAGQRVAQPTKGLYIVNGKKVVLNK